MSRQGARAWGVILAGGDGTRLQGLTARIEGDTRPKQFCRMLGDESLLTQTRRRISTLFASDEIITVVTKKHEAYYSPELNDAPRTAVIVQPENRGTGVAIGAAIRTLRELDADAIVASFPCDHHYRNEAAFVDAVAAGIEVARDNSNAIVLLGAEATYPETEYGWIEPVRVLANDARFAATPVHRFWEKPTVATAHTLLRRNCLWNTFVTVGRVGTFIEVLCRAAPNAMLTLSAGILENDLDSAYRKMPSIDFSRDVLAPQPEHLVVMRDEMSGWTDLGNPSRVFDTLARERIAPAWLEAIARIEMPVAKTNAGMEECLCRSDVL